MARVYGPVKITYEVKHLVEHSYMVVVVTGWVGCWLLVSVPSIVRY